MTEDPNPYLEYLNKEMTIMGVLSAFSIGTTALVIDKTIGGEKGALKELWPTHAECLLAGIAALTLSALLFYRQRSYLAWYYGQIALARVKGAAADAPLSQWLKDVDSWETWIHYRSAFLALSFAFVELALALVGSLNVPHVGSHYDTLVPLTALIVFGLLQRHVLTRYRYDDHPWRKRLGLRIPDDSMGAQTAAK